MIKIQTTECLECGTKFKSAGEKYGICKDCKGKISEIPYAPGGHTKPRLGADAQVNKRRRFVDKYSRGVWPDNDSEARS
jgi:tRNA(Ile2) C34 agmatinyltransferase TiaS